MKPLLQLNLQSNSEKVEAANLPKPDRVEPEPEEVRKRLDRIANRVAHKGTAEFRQCASGILSK
jgi:hypothetical protein